MTPVKLISYSTPAKDFLEESGLDKDSSVKELIAYCARVSNPSNQANTQTIDKLLSYLIKHQHWSPFEMVNVCMEINTTRDIARQILRHRSFSYQEFSQRYANPEALGDHFVIREARLQDTKNRQNSIQCDDFDLEMTWISKQTQVIEAASDAYNWAIANGIAKEQARAVLPEGLTKSKLYMNGTIRSWIHYIELREKNGTQKEHMDIAVECAKAISKVFNYKENKL